MDGIHLDVNNGEKITPFKYKKISKYCGTK